MSVLTEIQNGWYIGNENKNCDDVCTGHNLQCSEEELYRHNEDVASSEDLRNLIQTLGGSLLATSCGGQYGTAADIPNFSTSKDTCFFSDPTRELWTFNCARNPTPENQRKRRLCWCHSPDS